MFHPDQCYDVRKLQHQDLQAEVAYMRIAAQAREPSNDRRAYASAAMRRWALRLGAWLRLSPISRRPASKG
jgi:hypothetical protein